MRTIFHTHIGKTGELFQPEPREAEHLFKVFRARPGDQVLVMDGRCGRAKAEVVDKKQLRFLEPLPEVHQEIELDLYCAIPKKAKLDSLLPQLPGLGVRALHPLLLEHSVATGENPERWELLLREGCKQSGNPRLPQLYPPVSLEKALEEVRCSGAALYYGSVTPADPGAEAPGPVRAWFVGPEGGFTAEEEAQLLAAGGRPLKLGSWIMRLESAAVAGLAVLNRLVPLFLALFFFFSGVGCGDSSGVMKHPLMFRAERCRSEGEFRLALRFYNRLLAKRPDSSQLHLKMATLCDEDLSDTLGALYHYNAFLALAPDSPDAEAVQRYKQMAKAKILRDLKREKLPVPPADALEKQQKLTDALKEENRRLVRALGELTQKYNQLREYALRNTAERRYERNVPAAPVRSAEEELYTIRSGDTLSGIAHEHGVSLRSLMQSNGLNERSILRAGQVLKIPR